MAKETGKSHGDFCKGNYIALTVNLACDDRLYRYYEVKMTTEETTTEEETTFVKMAGKDDESSDVRGGQFGQSVDAEQLTSMSHEESSRFVIKSVIDPRTAAEISMDQVSSHRLSL